MQMNRHMTIFSLAIAFFSPFAVLGSSDAKAQQASSYIYEHNGSTMLVERDRRRVTITYETPRAALRNHGVKHGTLLFKGRLGSDGILEGDTRIFSAKCGTTPYYVHGKYEEGRSFSLSGAAPVFEKCRIVNNRYDIPNAKLVFNILKVSETAGSDMGPNVTLYCLRDVQSGLNLRVGPGTDYGIIAEIPVGSCNIQAQNHQHGEWLAVQWQGVLGWVSRRYLGGVR